MVSGAQPLPSPMCSLVPATRVVGPQWVRDLRSTIPITLSNGAQVVVGAEGMLRAHVLGHIESAFNRLLRNGDPLAKGHFVCVGLYANKERQARSFGQGYIVYGPSLLAAHGHPEALEFVALHEFAHQLQLWRVIDDHQARTAGAIRLEAPHLLFSSTNRGSELEADCVAAAFFRLARLYVPHRMWATQYGNVLVTALKMGDVDFAHHDHHGTGPERVAAAQAGVAVAEGMLAADPTGGRVNAGGLLTQCGLRVGSIGIR